MQYIILFILFVVPLASYGAYFIKLDGVDGESTESHTSPTNSVETSSGGKVETGWKVEEGESTTETEGETGGTEDINIGVGELQEGTDGDPDNPVVTGSLPNSEAGDEDHKDQIEIQSVPLRGVEPDEIDVSVSNTNAGIEPDEIDVALENENTGVEPDEIDFRDEDSDDDGLSDAGVEPDEIDFTGEDGTVYLRAGYLKIGDIKGESNDAEEKKGGNVEYTWKIEEGEKAASKPKEIVVVGSEVRGWDPKDKEAITSASREPQDVRTGDDLAAFMNQLVLSDEKIDEIEATEEELRMTYRHSVRLLGFIPVEMRENVSVSTHADEFGRVKVKFPWWHIFASGDLSAEERTSELETAISLTEVGAWKPEGETAAKEEGDDEDDTDTVPMETFSLNFEEIKAHILGTLSIALK